MDDGQKADSPPDMPAEVPNDELIERGGVYAKLHALQFAKERASAAA